MKSRVVDLTKKHPEECCGNCMHGVESFNMLYCAANKKTVLRLEHCQLWDTQDDRLFERLTRDKLKSGKQ